MTSNDTQITVATDRKVSDIILSLEERIILLTKTIAANDLTNKLILQRLNQLLEQQVSKTTSSSIVKQESASNIIQAQKPLIELSKEPIRTKRPQAIQAQPPVATSEKKQEHQTIIKGNKIPVAQRITDHTGKDLFNANVIISNLETHEEVVRTTTNPVGKWQAYLPVGNYSVAISKMDVATQNKIECVQELEISPDLKSLLLPAVIIKRNNV